MKRPSFGSDQVTCGTIARSSGGPSMAATHEVLPV
jgi:hypothetical protein